MNDRYEIRSTLGQGGLGEVFLAFDKTLNREVAVKRLRQSGETPLSDKAREDLVKEAGALSNFQHPNIVTIYDVGEDEEGAYVVMERLKGDTFDEVVQKGVLTLEDFGEVVSQILEAMVAAHESEIIHLDIKPANVMVVWLPSGKFQVKILDFGLATIAKAQEVTFQSEDEGGGILGSIHFMAPEQFERNPVNARTDLYSLGCLFYYGLTARNPFQGQTGEEVMHAHLNHTFTPLPDLRPDLPEWACNWVMWLMNRRPEERPESAKVALRSYRHIAKGQAAGETTRMVLQPSPKLNVPPVPPGATTMSLTGRQELKAPEPSLQTAGSKSKAPNKALGKKVAAQSAASSYQKPLPPPAKPLWAKLSTWLIASAVLLPICLWLVFSLVSKNRENERTQRFNTLVNALEPVGTAEDVALLLGYANDADVNTQNASLNALMLISAPEADELILEAYREAEAPLQRKLTVVLVRRDIAEAIPELVKVAQGSSSESAEVALEGLTQFGVGQFAREILDILSTAESVEVRQAAELALHEEFAKGVDAARWGPELMRLAKSNGEADLQASAFRLLGTLGHGPFLKLATKTFSGKDPAAIQAALVGLGNWPRAAQLDRLLALAEEEVLSATQKEFAYHQALEALRDFEGNQGNTKKRWERAQKVAQSPTRKLSFITALAGSHRKNWAIRLIQPYLKDPQLEATVRAAIEHMSG
ncbi:MAG: protein kinase [Verrucomicrobiota bacterium]